MRHVRVPCLLALLPLLLLARPSAAQVSPIEEQMAWMREQMELMRKEITGLHAELAAYKAGKPAQSEADEYYIPRLSKQFEESGQAPALGGLYTKPYLTSLGQRTYLGGYLEAVYEDMRGSPDRGFSLARFVPFIYSDVSDRVKMSSEIEFEDAGVEIELEFAQVDYLFNPAFNLRAGLMLLPVGKLNSVHDSPIQELTDRPLVDTLVIPTTLRDVGVGAYGRLGEQVSYEVALTNGFRGLDADGNVAINTDEGLHEAAPHEDVLSDAFSNPNGALAWSGRVAWQPVLGSEVGASALLDTYDELGHNDLRILALDGTVEGRSVSWLPDPLQLQGEAAWAGIERDAFAKASGVPNDMNGFYVQGNWRCEPDCLNAWKADGTISQDAHLTFVARYDRVHLDTYDRRRTTLGVNFRPQGPNTVFKLDYQFNDDTGSDKGAHDDDALLFSVATYF